MNCSGKSKRCGVHYQTNQGLIRSPGFSLYLLKTPCYARGSKELLAMDKKKTPVVQ